ncbi:MAG: NrtA/SsuA/CpmA family ABC transporter substrate-binding protein [Spirochaetaceae bacterium]|jgi:sulfonate transport system substrate-binding protein|nr:NrtA/SsuA/CpmA family ABC transporter substrate-binding protein [Spirochaetaceae bacterium]
MKKILVLVLSLFMVVLGSCKKKAAPEHLILSIPNQAMMGLFFIAENLGYFEDENLIIEVDHPSSGRDAMINVLEGRTDVGGCAEYPIAREIYNGAKLQILATISRTNNFLKMIARRNYNIEKIEDLVGKRIGYTFNSNAEYALYLFLNENGLDVKDVEKININPGDKTQALLEGEIDAVFTWQPHVINIFSSFPESELIKFSSQAYTNLGVLAFTSEKLKEKEDAFLRLGRILIRTEDYISLNSEEALKILIDSLSGQSPDMLSLIWSDLYYYARIDNLLLNTLLEEGLWIDNINGSPGKVPDYKKFLYTDVLKKARFNAVTLME